jgi:hypothetical protein
VSAGTKSLAAAILALVMAGCGRSVTILSWNVCNLFDAVDDGTEYREYDPGRGQWTPARYERRLDALATVIRRACPAGPDVIALQELENRGVLADLCARHLSGYRWIAVPAGPATSVTCGVASRLPIRRVAAVDAGEWEGRPLRPLLEVDIDCRGELLTLFVAHWKSRIQGEGGTRPARDAAAVAVARRVRALLAARPGSAYVLAGDLNENAGERAGGPALACVDSPGAGDGGVLLSLYDPWFSVAPVARGSAVYRGLWQTPDHILLPATLFDGRGLEYRSGSFAAVRHSFMLDPATGFPARDRGSGWRYSDHLPVIASLEHARPR